MSAILIFTFGFVAGAVSFAAATFLASLPRDEDWLADEALGFDASVPPQPGLTYSAGPTWHVVYGDDPATFIHECAEAGGPAAPVISRHRGRSHLRVVASN